jgi:hypothetical protein
MIGGQQKICNQRHVPRLLSEFFGVVIMQLTIAEAAIWIGFGSDARLSIPDIDIFNEWGGQSRLTAAEAALYIEVLP